MSDRKKGGLLPCYEGRQDCAMNVQGKCEALINMDFDGQCPFYKSKRELPMYETELMFFETGQECWGNSIKRIRRKKEKLKDKIPPTIRRIVKGKCKGK